MYFLKAILPLILIFHTISSSNTTTTYSEVLGKRSAYYQKVTYCPVEEIKTWECQACGKFPQMQEVTTMEDKIFGTLGYTGYDSEEDKIVVVFRGSYNAMNVLQDLDFRKGEYPLCENCEVHKGFYFAYETLRHQTFDALEILLQEHNQSQIFLIGHSLGGALASFAGLEIIQRFPQTKDTMIFYSLEMPRVGNHEFVSYFESMIPQGYRITHWKDPVVHIPLRSMKYYHYSTEVFYNENFTEYIICDGSGEDPKCADRFIAPKDTMDHVLLFNTSIGCGGEYLDIISQ